MNKLIVKSPAFEANTKIPKKYTCEGESVNPALTIEGVPKEAKSLALIFEDPDAVSGIFDHWIMWNIPPETSKIEENSAPGVEGLNSGRRQGYYPPCPPSGSHRYIFKVYALDQMLTLPEKTKKAGLLNAMQNHILAEGQIIGLYR
ncbi:MAG: YbhB/YbcL family Raf kinase inhibitor-like protein [Candidatus Bathyarchaeia archaeon]|jgi:Raf kinase inhibitor-like YbhB/YbcL family protein